MHQHDERIVAKTANQGKRRVRFDGKEVDRGTSTDPEYLPGDDNKLMRYGTAKHVFPETLRNLSVRELIKRTGLSNETVQRAKKSERIHPKTARRLSWCARLQGGLIDSRRVFQPIEYERNAERACSGDMVIARESLIPKIKKIGIREMARFEQGNAETAG